MGKLGEAICCFTEVTLIGCWGHTSEKRIIFCFCTHFVNIHSGINTTTSEFKKKGRNWILLHVFFPRHTPWTSYNNTTLYVSVLPDFDIEEHTLGVTGQHRMLNAPYDLILPLFFFQVRVCFLMQMFSIFLWTFHCGHCLLLPHVLHLKTRWFIISNT